MPNNQTTEVPTGIIVYGSPQFIAAVTPMIEEPGIWTVKAKAGDAPSLEKLARDLRPRAAVIELGHPEPRAGIAAGVAVQKGFRWATVVLMFDEPDESLLRVAASIKSRGWSLVSTGMVKSLGVKRVFNGAFTSHGLVDQAVAALKTAKAEQTDKPAETEAESEGGEEAA